VCLLHNRCNADTPGSERMSFKIVNDYTGWIDGKEYPSEVELCPCDPGHQDVMDIRFEHVKRDYYWAHYDMLCMECEMCWTESVYLIGQGSGYIITQMPTGDEEE